MTNKKGTKRALLTSVLSLLLCCSMLIGTTFAWFTDEVKSGTNIIAAGNLDIELYHSDKAVKDEKVNGGTKLFDDVMSSLWEPGAVAYEVLTVVNEGTLALKYNLAFHAQNATIVNGKSLADALKVAVVDEAELTDRESAIAAGNEAGWNNLASFDLPGTLAAEASETYGIVIYWLPTANDNDFNMNNENQGKTLSIELGVHLTATQLMSENDSFDNKYDEDGEFELIKTAEELAAALTSGDEYINVILGSDIDLPIGSLGTITGGSGEYKLGGENTKAINVDLNGHKLNITTTYWSNLGAKNNDTVITFANGTMTSSQATGTWNSYDLTFSNCKYVFENVVFEKAVALESGAVLKNVTINETHDYYALWISANGQTVEIDGLTVNSLGRGIKIDEQYVGAPAKVTLKVSNAIFDTNKKAAIMVKSVAGADIILSNVNIANTPDPIHEVWVDEASVAYADLVTVTGGTKANENDVLVATATPDTIQSMIDNAVAGDVILLGAGEYTNTINMKSGITLQGTKNAVVDCINLNGADNVTLKNIKFNAASAKVCYDGKGNGKQYANIISGDASKNGKGTLGLVIDGCTFVGEFADGGVAIAFTDQGRGSGQSGNITITNCTFETTGSYYDIYMFYSGKGELNIKNNTFASDCLGLPIYLGRYQSSTPVVLTGNTFKVADLENAVYLQAHSGSYTPSLAAEDNTFNG